jgi:hypothetical protein
MTPRSLKKEWAAAMVELLSQPVNQAKIRKVLRILGHEDKGQEVLDV